MNAMLVSEDINDQGNGRTAFREWTVRFDLICQGQSLERPRTGVDVWERHSRMVENASCFQSEDDEHVHPRDLHPCISQLLG